MSRVILIQVDRCEFCPSRFDRWRKETGFQSVCDREEREIDYHEKDTPFPAWCPLPEKEKEESK